jgi:hypothetical protein
MDGLTLIAAALAAGVALVRRERRGNLR